MKDCTHDTKSHTLLLHKVSHVTLGREIPGRAKNKHLGQDLIKEMRVISGLTDDRHLQPFGWPSLLSRRMAAAIVWLVDLTSESEMLVGW